MKESIDNNGGLHAQQSCTYSSIINVNKSNYPFSSSYEHEQTWTLTRTLSKNHKRYQSVIENIHLNRSSSTDQTQHYTKVPLCIAKSNHCRSSNSSQDRVIPSTPIVLTSKKRISSSARSMINPNFQRNKQRHSSTLLLNSKSEAADLNISSPMIKPMELMHNKGEFIIRI